MSEKRPPGRPKVLPPEMNGRLKTDTLTLRLDPDLRERVEVARLAMPYKPTVTAIVERGLQLALAELELMTSEGEGLVRLAVIREKAKAEAMRETAE